jgi:hypothetical protein
MHPADMTQRKVITQDFGSPERLDTIKPGNTTEEQVWHARCLVVTVACRSARLPARSAAAGK